MDALSAGAASAAGRRSLHRSVDHNFISVVVAGEAAAMARSRIPTLADD